MNAPKNLTRKIWLGGFRHRRNKYLYGMPSHTPSRRSRRRQVIKMAPMDVVDDWPRPVPLTEPELVALDRYLGSELDAAVIGPYDSVAGLLAGNTTASQGTPSRLHDGEIVAKSRFGRTPRRELDGSAGAVARISGRKGPRR
jgi:hypothetical protein